MNQGHSNVSKRGRSCLKEVRVQVYFYPFLSQKVKGSWLFRMEVCRNKETGAKKNKTGPRNPYFLSDQADILVTLPTHELSTLTKFHCNRAKTVNSSVMG